MSLINQMLRDLQQRRDGRPSDMHSAPPIKPRLRPRRAFSVTDRMRAVPPLLWVGLGGLAGLLLLWGASDWLSGMLGPNAPATVTQPPPELVAIANAPQPPGIDLPTSAKRRAPPVPTDAPPPPPPLAYGSTEPATTVLPPAPVAAPQPASPAAPVLPVQSFSSAPPPPLPAAAVVYPSPRPLSVAAAPRSGAAPSPAVPRIPGIAVDPPGRLHPDMLPGAVNATNLALQKAAREVAAVPPPAVTPYGQAENAYRQGRQAYEDNQTEASLEALRRALEFYPGHLPARELLADQLEMAGRTDEAFALLKQGLAIAPDYTPFRKHAARMLLDRGDAGGATRALIGNGLPRTEDDPELHRLLAGIYLRLGESFLAAQTYRNLLVHDPQRGSLWVGLGDALSADGQPAEARKAYRRALTVGGLNREEVARVSTGLAQL